MNVLPGVLLLFLALAAMYWLIRSWDAIREQFGAQLQALFRPQQSADVAAPADPPVQTLHEPPPQRIEERRRPRGQAHAQSPSTRRHAPTSRHH